MGEDGIPAAKLLNDGKVVHAPIIGTDCSRRQEQHVHGESAQIGEQSVQMITVGDRLKSRVKDLGLKEAEAARRVGLSAKRFNNYANNLREPDLKTLLTICDKLQISPNDLLGYARASQIVHTPAMDVPPSPAFGQDRSAVDDKGRKHVGDATRLLIAFIAESISDDEAAGILQFLKATKGKLPRPHQRETTS